MALRNGTPEVFTESAKKDPTRHGGHTIIVRRTTTVIGIGNTTPYRTSVSLHAPAATNPPQLKVHPTPNALWPPCPLRFQTGIRLRNFGLACRLVGVDKLLTWRGNFIRGIHVINKYQRFTPRKRWFTQLSVPSTIEDIMHSCYSGVPQRWSDCFFRMQYE